LMKLPGSYTVHPGHAGETSIENEWENNPFIRTWRGVDAVSERPCRALGQPASLLLSARDYDGGTKCWVRFEDAGQMDIVPGSRVTEEAR
ncbi:MAG: hypothetical protein ACE5IK_13320, partial [Acidobacteriota bacterium]